MDTNDLPNSWPPNDDGGTKVLPIFPLPNVWLFPGAVVPLQIFEPRYIQLIEDCLDGPGRFVLGTIEEGHEPEHLGAPPFASVAGFGEIGRHDRMPDGRFQIVLIGLGRVRVEEVDSDRQYRKVRAQGLIETGTSGDDEPELRRNLMRAIQVRTAKAMPGQPIPAIPADVPIGRLADLLSLRMPLPHSALTKIFNEIDVTTRARMVLDEDKLRPLLPPGPQPRGPNQPPGGSHSGETPGGNGES